MSGAPLRGRIVGVRAGRARERARPAWDRSDARTRTSAYGKPEVAGPVAIGVEGGVVRAGDPIERLACPHPDWSILRVFRAIIDRTTGRDAVAFLAACPELAADARAHFAARLAAGSPDS